jgi:hypothetical protein
MSIELKIKSKHLALEPAIIRREEQKLLKRIRSGRCNDTADGSTTASLLRKFESLHNHRKWNVRNEARATELARAYLSGRPYNDVEWKRKPENEFKFKRYIIPRIVSMVTKYGNEPVTSEQIEKWSDID